MGREPLRHALASMRVAGKVEVLAAAQRLLKLVDPEGAATGKYAVTSEWPRGQRVGH